jgi:signal transduction histidine kinase
LGLLITLAAVAGYSAYTLHQLETLRRLQTDTIDRNRHDSLRLLSAQSDLNMISLRVRDMVRSPHSSNLQQYRVELDRLRTHLQNTVAKEARSSPLAAQNAERQQLLAELSKFWQISDQVFAHANAGADEAARAEASSSLFSQQSILAQTFARLLEANSEVEERADQRVASIYSGVERNIYVFLAATILGILITSSLLIFSNRRMFDQMEAMSKQRRILAARLISVQEEVLRSVSRELHDEFGQILTAVGAMLARAEKKGLPPDSPFRTELTEVREITHNTLEKMRSLSQMLHPAVIDDYGLVKGLEWYVGVFEKQTGIATKLLVHGVQERITGPAAIHTFRIVQESLNNAAKHSGAKRAEVELEFGPQDLTVIIMDFGKGLRNAKDPEKKGLGLIAMRERAELVGGTLNIRSTPGAGTTVTMTMPLHLTEQSVRSEGIEEEAAFSRHA